MIWLLVCSAILIVMTACWLENSRYTPWNEIADRSISEEEFLSALPNVTAWKALRVRAIVAEQLDIPIQCIHPDDRFIEDLRAD